MKDIGFKYFIMNEEKKVIVSKLGAQDVDALFVKSKSKISKDSK